MICYNIANRKEALGHSGKRIHLELVMVELVKSYMVKCSLKKKLKACSRDLIQSPDSNHEVYHGHRYNDRTTHGYIWWINAILSLSFSLSFSYPCPDSEYVILFLTYPILIPFPFPYPFAILFPFLFPVLFLSFSRPRKRRSHSDRWSRASRWGRDNIHINTSW